MNILITGTSRGIGREFVEQFLAKNSSARIWAVSTHADALKELATKYSGRLVLLPVSVSDEACKNAIRESLAGESLDLLINNAGKYPLEPPAFEEISTVPLQQAFEVNVYAAFRVTQACIPALKRSKNPKVIHISSLMGSISDNESGGHYAYRMSKAAMNMFNKSFSIDFPMMTSIVMHPGWVKTDMGGANAPTTKEESVRGMIAVIEKLKRDDSGKFFDFEGEEIGW